MKEVLSVDPTHAMVKVLQTEGRWFRVRELFKLNVEHWQFGLVKDTLILVLVLVLSCN